MQAFKQIYLYRYLYTSRLQAGCHLMLQLASTTVVGERTQLEAALSQRTCFLRDLCWYRSLKYLQVGFQWPS
jgi:hypothetical protein